MIIIIFAEISHPLSHVAQYIVVAISIHDAVSAKMNVLPDAMGDSYTEFLRTIEGDTLQQLE
jgi:hypothetical protein